MKTQRISQEKTSICSRTPLRDLRLVLPLALTLGLLSLAQGALATKSDRVASMPRDIFLEKFVQNPKAAMSQLPTKKHWRPLPFSYQEIRNGNFISLKDKYRRRLCSKSLPGEFCMDSLVGSPVAGIDAENQMGRFFPPEVPLVSSLKLMEEQNLLNGKVAVQPWSGDYWPIYKGSIGFRYADPTHPYSVKFSVLRKYYESYWPLKLNTASYVENMAPSEKYDVLVKDDEMTLTKYSWREAESYLRDDEIETWMGLCHGWAVAAFMVPRPTKTVDIKLGNTAVPLRFYPDDIKALATALWANAPVSTYFLGGRCNDKKPNKDENGRILSSDCFDANPGSWHMALVNQLGIHKKSFVIDATYDYEVWNQPVVSYSYSYFDPRDKKPVDNLAKAAVEVEKMPRDIFAKYRSPLARYIVGVIMDLTYVVENTPSHRMTDRPENDYLNSVRYYYDLELDSSFRIIGGEWYQNAHPDMLWMPTGNSKAMAYTDYLAKTDWKGQGPVPMDWTKAAGMASDRGQPLSRVLDFLVKLAQ